TDVDLGFSLTVSTQQVEPDRRREGGLSVLAGEAQADLAEHPQAGRGVDLERLGEELALPPLERERLPGPAALGLADESPRECLEMRSAGEGVRSEHGSRIEPARHHGESRRRTDEIL